MMRNEGVAGRTDSRSWAEAMPMVGGVEGPASAGHGRVMWVSRVRAAHLLPLSPRVRTHEVHGTGDAVV